MFELLYYKSPNLRHNLDVMDIEKNVYESVVRKSFNIPGKTKDDLNDNKYEVRMGLWTQISLVVHGK